MNEARTAKIEMEMILYVLTLKPNKPAALFIL